LPEMDISQASPEDDVTLLQLMIAAEERGFVTLYRKYQAQVYRFSLHFTGARQVAEEVTQ
jgi:DNA-directed RNA polymerase specialized sigma24 family protein